MALAMAFLVGALLKRVNGAGIRASKVLAVHSSTFPEGPASLGGSNQNGRLHFIAFITISSNGTATKAISQLF